MKCNRVNCIMFFLIILSEAVWSQKNDSFKISHSDWCDSIILHISKDIELLKVDYPQLMNFDKEKNIIKGKCKIDYAYHCYQPKTRAGWTSGVPNPHPNGIWFYISIWDENDPVESMAQINTQPMMPEWFINDKRLTFLILEGKKTELIYQKLFSILKEYGLREQ